MRHLVYKIQEVIAFLFLCLFYFGPGITTAIFWARIETDESLKGHIGPVLITMLILSGIAGQYGWYDFIMRWEENNRKEAEEGAKKHREYEEKKAHEYKVNNGYKNFIKKIEKDKE